MLSDAVGGMQNDTAPSKGQLYIRACSDPAISPPEGCPTSTVQRTAYVCIRQFITELHNNKRLEIISCPSTRDWFNQLWHIHTTDLLKGVKNIVMVNFICQLDGTLGWPTYLVSHYSGCFG